MALNYTTQHNMEVYGMARITAFVSEKGGVGKSTGVQNMSVQRAKRGNRVLLLDADPQRTTMKWAARRSLAGVMPAILCIEATASNLQKTLEKYDELFDEILIDTGGADSTEMRLALTFADVIVCPCQPSQADIETLETINALLAKTRKERPEVRAHIATFMAPTNAHSTEAEEMQEFCGMFDNLPILNTIIRYRKAYKLALRDGLGVTEMDNNDLTAKAIAETEALEEEIWNEPA